MKLRTLLVILSLQLLTTQVQAKPVYLQMFASGFPDAKVSTYRCQYCHASTSLAMNSFGKAFSKSKNTLGLNKISDVWVEISDMDSDKDGLSNIEEINMGRNPGVAGK